MVLKAAQNTQGGKKWDTAYFDYSETYICLVFIRFLHYFALEHLNICKLCAVHGKDLKFRHLTLTKVDFMFIICQGHIKRSRIKHFYDDVIKDLYQFLLLSTLLKPQLTHCQHFIMLVYLDYGVVLILCKYELHDFLKETVKCCEFLS